MGRKSTKANPKKGSGGKGSGGGPRKGQNHDSNPRPLKAAKFNSADDDNYCSNMCVLIGPKKKPPFCDVLLTVLGLGPQFRQCDMVDYALPMEQDDIQGLHDDMINEGWKLPAFNIRQGEKQGIYRQRTEQAYKSWLTKRAGTKRLNTHYIDVHDAATVEWSIIQTLLSSVLQFFRDVWILNPNLSKDQVYRNATKILKVHIKTKSQRRSFFTRYISEKRQKLAYAALDDMEDLLVNNRFPDPVQACKDIRVILEHLGLSSKGSDRKCFEKMQVWFSKIPMASTEMIERFEWLDPEGDLVLQELPDEAAVRIEKEKAARAEKERTEEEKAEVEEPAEAARAEQERTEREKEQAARTEQERTDIAAAALLDVGTVRTHATAGATSDQTNQNGSDGTNDATVQNNQDGSGGTNDEIRDHPEESEEGRPEESEEEKKEETEEAQPAVEIIDLTVEDLKPLQCELDQKAGKLVQALAREGMENEGPKPLKKGEGGRIKYSSPKSDWQASKTWEFTQIQVLVNLLTTLYGLKPPRTSEPDRMKRVVRCGNKLGYFVVGSVPAKKANIQAHLQQWLPEHLRSTFIPYTAMLEGLLSPAVNQEEVVRKNYRLAKCALVNSNWFSPYASASLQQVIDKIVALEVEKIAATKANQTRK